MSCWLSEDQKESRRINEEIEKIIKADRKKMKYFIKLLLLGTGESGKTTFLKQMRIINNDEFSNEEKLSYTRTVYRNIFMAMQSMIKAMDELEISYSDVKNIDCAELVSLVDCDTMKTLKDPFLSAIKCLWKDFGIQKCYSRRKEYYLMDSAEYFLCEIERIEKPDYIPSEQDILRVRSATTGINQYDIKMDRFVIRMVDVGGQRSERKKWIHCFENVDLIIFLVAISEYDQNLCESENVNRMEESKALFETIVNSHWFEKSAFVLFLNKIDLFEDQIKDQDKQLVKFYPLYEGPKGDSKAARDFIRRMFLSLNHDYERDLYCHYTCATDTSNMKLVFAAVKNTIMSNLLESINIS
ncbi:G protein alpha q subunit-like [Drosophila sulfurigaster albostrigata]|uniref:G protein alpha q subunit-like n=1 Tax=Drosophila sulfurigaster albostrigata TaxID=89887 RepID=UPI002D21B55F|nr:G protein alpha q subunit-like [Drosophila sulfurigaster albostrigata]